MAATSTRSTAQAFRPHLQSSTAATARLLRPQLQMSSRTPQHRRPLSTIPLLRSQQTHPNPQFTYHVAASYIGKDKAYDPSTHIFHFNPYNRVQPPPRKRSKRARPESGQDAFFVTRLNAPSGTVALGVADGVGGWMDSGVDPADFSHGFCDYMAAAAHAFHPAPGQQPLSAKMLMQAGYEAICADPDVPAGGSTAIVSLLDPAGWLEVANLGDSGYIHLRLNAVCGQSEPQTHAFNTPYQLSVIPPAILRRMQAFGGSQLADMPNDADVSRHNLRHGDVVVFATDGVWDNLFNQDILRIVSEAMTKKGAWVDSAEGGTTATPDLLSITEPAEGSDSAVGTLQAAIAIDITRAAKSAGLNSKLDGPFAKEVKKYYPHERWRGGKPDDICVVAVVVSENKSGDGPVKSKL